MYDIKDLPKVTQKAIKAFRGHPSIKNSEEHVTQRAAKAGTITKIALISHDYNISNSKGRTDYSEHFSCINTLCDQQRCDTILYAPYTWNKNSPTITHNLVFEGLQHVQRVIVEIERPCNASYTEVWMRGQNAPFIAKQYFAYSKDSKAKKQAFIQALPDRKVANAVLVLCGESNIVKLHRNEKWDDPFKFLNTLKKIGAPIILNPIHDYKIRSEMRKKRRYYSKAARVVISVWNEGKGRDAKYPWTVFSNNKEMSSSIMEIAKPFEDRPDIRIGIIDVGALGV